jgi:hypothetical protein
MKASGTFQATPERDALGISQLGMVDCPGLPSTFPMLCEPQVLILSPKCGPVT